MTAKTGSKPRQKPGPKAHPRKKALISMTTSEYDEFSSWANDAGMTKSMLMHDLISRERERRRKLKETDHG